jgi:hypothetical protein
MGRTGRLWKVTDTAAVVTIPSGLKGPIRSDPNQTFFVVTGQRPMDGPLLMSSPDAYLIEVSAMGQAEGLDRAFESSGRVHPASSAGCTGIGR